MKISHLSPSLVAGVLLAFLAGCSNTPKPGPVAVLSDSSTCATKVSLASAKPLPYDPEKATAIDLRINATSACVTGESGARSLYDVVALPDAGIAYSLSVGSYPVGDTILTPRVQLLGRDGAVLREISRQDFIYRGKILTAMVRAHKDECYLVVRSDPETVGKDERQVKDGSREFPVLAIIPGGVAAGSFSYGTSSIETKTYVHSGLVKVVIRPLATSG